MISSLLLQYISCAMDEYNFVIINSIFGSSRAQKNAEMVQVEIEICTPIQNFEALKS